MKQFLAVLIAAAAILAGVWIANSNQESIREERFKTGYERAPEELKQKYQEAVKDRR